MRLTLDGANPRCSDCGERLTDEEFHYYEHRCNNCEGVWLDTIETWRHGGRNDYLDKLYAADDAK